ncbi:tetraspanin-1 isoform X2 [Bombus affinis]|nr:tetraspanin-1 isoform X2 [Bombus affinis]XP_050598360.1 tetraspanin-1 isoform X2 [Bombus affinis]XP_050598361.1 tetraspanin-1 isoform X2 [Bombus affinis]XP_050598363.1 tetraspanin-1 isoform X2 [Bombus affinis]XP_050598364.1 tetraspanin-1 isoform X2 [Bombus affinis]XP_050598365.1 tetraspanin-1 isoform X2 [Bombus affinis]XP_050598366.1 tetraspanin-1 isoform X2 [Bombus affinis]
MNEAKMGCASQCAKYFLCFFNFVFFVAGGAALAVGVWLFVDSNSFTDLVGKLDQSDILNKTDTDVIRIISYILILAGALTFLISFLGYCGAMFESRCLLCVYGVLILLVLILESVVVGLAFGLKGDAEQSTRDFLKSTIKYYASSIDKTETITVTWDGIMTQLHCCGVDNHLDFRESTNWTSTDKILPEACCIKENNILKDPSCPVSPTSNNSYYKQGCYGAIMRTIEENAAIVIGVAAGLAFVEILVIILALHLACCYWRPQHVLTCWCCC